MRIAGIDPSLSNFGLAKGILLHDTHQFTLEDVTLVETKPNNNKSVRQNSKDLERAKTLYERTIDYIADVDVVIAEIPVGSQSARSMASYGVCLGILASLNRPIIQVTPSEVKLASAGTKTASKQDMIDWATSLYPDVSWLTRTVKGETTLVAKNEHIADAVATIHAGLKTDMLNQLIHFQKNLKL